MMSKHLIPTFLALNIGVVTWKETQLLKIRVINVSAFKIKQTLQYECPENIIF